MLIFWGISALGFIGASFFVSNKLATKLSIMSPRTCTQLFFLSIILLAAPVLLLLSMLLYLRGERNWKVKTILALNALPVIFMILLCIMQNGSIRTAYSEVHLLVSETLFSLTR